MFSSTVARGGDLGSRLSGAFIQLDEEYSCWSSKQWSPLLGRMRAARCDTIVLQYLEKRDADEPPTSESYVPAKPDDADPLGAILAYADARPEMVVFIGLRFDNRLLSWEYINQPSVLRAALQDELARNRELAKKVASRYQLSGRRCFAGWYLPIEVANYTETVPTLEDGWIFQLNSFTTKLIAACQELVDKPVAVSPYFNGKLEGRPDLVPAGIMRQQYARFLKGTGIDVVMLQDGVAVGHIPANQVAGYVEPYLRGVKMACEEASPASRPIECWLNVESERADIERLKTQMSVGRNLVKRIVTFDFPHDLNKSPLYDDYLRYLAGL